MKKSPEWSEDVIAKIKEAEELNNRELEDAAAGKTQRIQKAKEKSASAIESAKKEADSLYNKLISDARKKLGAEERSIEEESEKEAAELQKKKINSLPKALAADLWKSLKQ